MAYIPFLRAELRQKTKQIDHKAVKIIVPMPMPKMRPIIFTLDCSQIMDEYKFGCHGFGGGGE